MKKFLTIALALSALGLVMAGCSGGETKDEGASTSTDATKTEEGK